MHHVGLTSITLVTVGEVSTLHAREGLPADPARFHVGTAVIDAQK